MRIKCPRCGRETIWEGNRNRPFCSENCRTIDLGQWLSERYRVPVTHENEDGAAAPDSKGPAE